MAERFAKDRFDTVPTDIKRVGAHRAPPRKGRGWFVFLWAALATLVLVVVGIISLLVLDNRLSIGTDSAPAPSAVASETVPPAAPTIDPAATITVLNGTETQGLASTAIEQLNTAGWTQPITNANASDRAVKSTTVYYEDAAQEGAARGIAEALGGAAITLSTEFQIPPAEGEAVVPQIWVVLGADYVPPAAG